MFLRPQHVLLNSKRPFSAFKPAARRATNFNKAGRYGRNVNKNRTTARKHHYKNFFPPARPGMTNRVTGGAGFPGSHVS